MRPYEPHIPKNISEIWDLLGSIMISSPRFEDSSGFFQGRNIDTEFFRLKEGLKSIRDKAGEEMYSKLDGMADKMRMHFEADPEDKTGDGVAGRQLIQDMEEELNKVQGWMD